MGFIRVHNVRGTKVWEWLLIIAILFVLAAVAVPNFMEPGQRYLKIIPTNRRMRQTTDALEKFHAKNGAYPGQRALREFAKNSSQLDRAGGGALFAIDPGGPGRPGLTTPVAYLASLKVDPFASEKGLPFAYFTDGKGWILFSAGFDGHYDINPKRDYDSAVRQPSAKLMILSFDPTNGTVSNGDVFRVSP